MAGTLETPILAALLCELQGFPDRGASAAQHDALRHERWVVIVASSMMDFILLCRQPCALLFRAVS